MAEDIAGKRAPGSVRVGVAVGLLGFLLFCGLLIFMPFGPVFRIYSLPSGSMEPNLRTGSYGIVNRASYGYAARSFDLFRLPISGRWPALPPARGDIVVFWVDWPDRAPEVWVKRVIGMPGDRVQLLGGRLYLNGKVVERVALPQAAVPDPYGKGRPVPTWKETLPDGVSYTIVELEGDTGRFDTTEEFLVPPGHFFALGDNRDNSVDSRMTIQNLGIGFVRLENIVGKVTGAFGGH